MENDLDDLWEMTEGTPECPKCSSLNLVGHIREVSLDLATVDWVCKSCSHKWSVCCPFKNGVLKAVDSEV